MFERAEDEGDRILEAGLLQRLAMGRIAVDGPDSVGCRARRTVSMFSSMTDRLDLVLAEQPGQGPPDRTVPDDDGPVTAGFARLVGTPAIASGYPTVAGVLMNRRRARSRGPMSR